MLKDQSDKLKDFLIDNKDLLIIIADPKTDRVMTGFGEIIGLVQFPFEKMEDGIVFNALRQSKFKEAIDPFMAGIEKGTGITVEDNQQLAHIIGGSIKSIGTARAEERSALQEQAVTVKKNVKSKKR